MLKRYPGLKLKQILKLLGCKPYKYYRWKTKIKKTKKCHPNTFVCNKIIQLNKARKTSIYGYRRMKIYLEQEFNLNYSVKQIRKLMYDHHLIAKCRIKKSYYHKEKIINIYEDNLINHNYETSNSKDKWVMDIKYIQTLEGTLYLNIIRDVHSQAILAYEMNNKCDYQTLVKPCLESALSLFSYKVSNLIIHTDNGSQYRCFDFYQLTKKYNIKTSKSRPGISTDNGLAENWFLHLSAEWIKKNIYKSLIDAKNDITEYITFYNHQRIYFKFKNSPWKNVKLMEN